MRDILDRYLTCTKCKKVWNVSRKSLYVNSSYICPYCKGKERKNGEISRLRRASKRS